MGDMDEGDREGDTAYLSPNVKRVPDAAPAAVRKDAGKDRWDLMPWDAAREIVRVLTWAACRPNTKYGERNWEKGLAMSRCYASMQRHLTAWFQDGEDLDPESGLHHLAHAGCNVMFLLATALRPSLKSSDDRPSRK